MTAPPGPVAGRDHWLLDPTVTHLNHGSYGTTPRAVLDEQTAWRTRMERDPVRFLGSELEGCLDAARAALAPFLGADPADIVFVPNATTGVDTVLRSRVSAQVYNAAADLELLAAALTRRRPAGPGVRR